MEFGGQGPRAGADEMGVGGYAPSHSSGNNGAAAAAGHREEEAEAVRYHECLRNHAAAQGGHVVDGCGEFMSLPVPAALACAACGCHRSFHRKEDAQQQRCLPPPPPPLPYPPFPYHRRRTPSGGGTTTTESSSEDPRPPPSHAGPAQEVGRRKRFRTRFTAEQKERMQAFAERVGWRMQRQDEAMVDRFCAQLGVRRQVFKVWMHNNKQLRRQQKLDHRSQSQQQQDQQQQK